MYGWGMQLFSARFISFHDKVYVNQIYDGVSEILRTEKMEIYA